MYFVVIVVYHDLVTDINTLSLIFSMLPFVIDKSYQFGEFVNRNITQKVVCIHLVKNRNCSISHLKTYYALLTRLFCNYSDN